MGFFAAFFKPHPQKNIQPTSHIGMLKICFFKKRDVRQDYGTCDNTCDNTTTHNTQAQALRLHRYSQDTADIQNGQKQKGAQHKNNDQRHYTHAP